VTLPVAWIGGGIQIQRLAEVEKEAGTCGAVQGGRVRVWGCRWGLITVSHRGGRGGGVDRWWVAEQQCGEAAGTSPQPWAVGGQRARPEGGLAGRRRGRREEEERPSRGGGAGHQDEEDNAGIVRKKRPMSRPTGSHTLPIVRGVRLETSMD
jgi:hypothetical protein